MMMLCKLYIGYLVAFIPFFICQIVYFCRIKIYDVTGYNCSDSITNELIRKGTENNYKQILYITIYFYLNIFQAGINCLTVLIGLCLTGIDKCLECCQNRKGRNYLNRFDSISENYFTKNCETYDPEIHLIT